MEERKGDARISVISGLFFACIIGGGVFLFLYMLLPEEKTQPWYPFVGMLLVAIPWVFWLITCVYRCFKTAGAVESSGGRYAKAGSSRAATIPTTTSGALTADAPESPVHSTDGARKVQFAGVVVLGNEDEEGGRGGQKANQNHHQTIDMGNHNNNNNNNGIHDSVGSADSEVPLKLMALPPQPCRMDRSQCN